VWKEEIGEEEWGCEEEGGRSTYRSKRQRRDKRKNAQHSDLRMRWQGETNM
jgi:hypothetical protein